MKKTFAERNRLFFLSILLFVAGVALVWFLFMPWESRQSSDGVPSSVIRLTEGLEKVRLNEGMQVLSDPEGSLTYAQVQVSPAKERFVPASGRTAFGLDGNTYWIRSTITNETSKDRWVLRLSNAIVDTVALYADGQRLGTDESIGAGEKLADHYWAYELALPADRPVTLYLRATTEGSMILPLELMSSSAYHGKLRAEYMLFGLYYGFVLLMAAYSFSMYVFMRNNAYLFYSLYIVCFALSQLFWNGLPQEMLGEHSSLIRLLLRTFDSYEGIFLFFFILCLWFALFFIVKVLHLNVYASSLRYVVIAIKWASPFVVLALLFHWPGFSTIAIWYELVIALLMIVTILLSVFRGNIAARYLALALIAFIGLVYPSVLYTFSLAGYNVLTHYGYQLGSVTEFIVITSALSYQTRQFEREMISAQRQMISNQEKLVRTLERWNEELEHTVGERTEKLVQSQRRRNELLQNISHDVRSPLTVVQGGIKAMMLGIQVHPGEQNKHLENLYGKVVYITRFIDDLFRLSLAEQEAAATYESTEELSMKPWVEREFVFFEEFVQNAGLQCEKEIRSDCDPFMTIDSHGMRRVLSNLVHNACKYSPANKRVRLEATIRADGVRISVEDEGQGIGAEDLNGIFDRNNRGSQSDPSTGSGLGLAIAKEIVERHGGTIAAESEPGKGSKFVVYLPADGYSRVPAESVLT
ncbi:ATP-binding protein [Cohnella suwonensis]|uniref:histidine kinase n=1 Tax=Cohnella suwonensis TaxID=696072 RepID=A0ABW0M160_9BACL